MKEVHHYLERRFLRAILIGLSRMEDHLDDTEDERRPDYGIRSTSFVEFSRVQPDYGIDKLKHFLLPFEIMGSTWI